MRRAVWVLLAVVFAACAPVVAPQTTTTAPPTTAAVYAPRMVPPTIPAYAGSGEPLDVLVVGDSTAYGIDTYLRPIILKYGYPGTVTTEWRGSTGIAGMPPPSLPQVDWLVLIDELLAKYQPDVVVAQWIGSFDVNPPTDTITRGTTFAEKVHAAGALLVQVRTPAVDHGAAQPYYDAIIDALDQIPADAFADWRTLLTPGDRWVKYGTTDRGVESIRTDGLHLDAAGRRLAAVVTMAALVPFWG